MAWQYPGGLTDTDFSDALTTGGWSPWSYIYGAHFTLSAGTVTMLGVKVKSESGATRNLKFGLYNSSGTLLAQSTATVSSITLAWVDSGSISASVSSGTHYVLVSSDGDGANYAQYGYDTSGNGSYATENYATAMASSETISDQADTGQLYGVRLDFTADGGGGGSTTSLGGKLQRSILLNGLVR